MLEGKIFFSNNHPIVVSVIKQKYAEAIGVQSSQAANARAPMNMKEKIRMRLTVIGTITRSVGM